MSVRTTSAGKPHRFQGSIEGLSGGIVEVKTERSELRESETLFRRLLEAQPDHAEGRLHFGRVLGLRWIGLPATSAQYFLLGTASISVLRHEQA